MDWRQARETIESYYINLDKISCESYRLTMIEKHLSDIDADFQKVDNTNKSREMEKAQKELERQKKEKELELIITKNTLRRLEEEILVEETAFGRLEEDLRDILHLKFKRKKTYTAIAMELNMSETTARRTVKNALCLFGANMAELR